MRMFQVLGSKTFRSSFPLLGMGVGALANVQHDWQLRKSSPMFVNLSRAPTFFNLPHAPTLPRMVHCAGSEDDEDPFPQDPSLAQAEVDHFLMERDYNFFAEDFSAEDPDPNAA